MLRYPTALFLILLPASALAQPLVQNIPSPGTTEPAGPIKTVADGPPRSLIRTDVPDQPGSVAVAKLLVSGDR